MRLDRFIRIHWPDIASGQLAAVTKRGGLTVDGRRMRGEDALAAGAVVRLDVPEDPRLGRAPSELGESDAAFLAAITLHEDDTLLILNKPAGLAVHRGTRTDGDLDSLLAQRVDARGERPLLVHRLDKDTSGVLLAAKTRDIAARLGKALAAHDFSKTYRALVTGTPPPDGRIDLALKKVATSAGSRMVAANADDPEALTASTTVRVLGEAALGLAVELSPLTGRQHQLRAHMAALGCPILGDRLYGGAPAARLMLHAFRLDLPDPLRRGHRLRFEAPLPQDFA